MGVQRGTPLPQPLTELGIEKTQSHRFQTEASLPEDDFEQHITETKTRGSELVEVGRLLIEAKTGCAATFMSICSCCGLPLLSAPLLISLFLARLTLTTNGL